MNKKNKEAIREFIRSKGQEIFSYAKELFPEKANDKLVIQVNTNTKGGVCIGGVTKTYKPIIIINYKEFYKNWLEDKAFKDGYKALDHLWFKTKSFKKVLVALLVHEIAHSVDAQYKFPQRIGFDIPVDFSDIEVNSTDFNEIGLGHGSSWQYIHHRLAEKFLDGVVYKDGNMLK